MTENIWLQAGLLFHIAADQNNSDIPVQSISVLFSFTNQKIGLLFLQLVSSNSQIWLFHKDPEEETCKIVLGVLHCT